MTRKKIAIFTGSDIRNYGGGEKYTIDMSNKLSPSRFDVTIFSYRVNKRHRLDDAAVHKLTKSKVIFYNTLSLPIAVERLPLTYSAFKAFYSIKDYDTVYNFDPSLLTNLKLTILGKIFGTKIIFGDHEPNLLRNAPLEDTPLKKFLFPFFKPVRNLVIMNIPNIHAISRRDEKDLKSAGYRGRIYYIPNFITTKPDTAVKKTAKDFVALFVGRLSIGQKGLDLFKEIIEDTIRKNPKIKFHIVGSGDDGEPLVRAIAQKHPNNVKFYGFISDAKLKDEYSAASVFLLTSRTEGLPRNLMEALYFGLPAVSFRIRGADEIICDGIEGKLVTPFDTKEFSKSIQYYYSIWQTDKKRYSKIKSHNSMLMEKRYDDKIIVPKLERMLSE